MPLNLNTDTGYTKLYLLPNMIRGNCFLFILFPNIKFLRDNFVLVLSKKVRFFFVRALTCQDVANT